MNTPLSYSSLLTHADENWNRYKAEADRRDAAFYGPGKLMRTVMRPIEQRLPPSWDAFMQALQNNGVSAMRSFPSTQVMGKTNQLGSVSGPEPTVGRVPEGTPMSLTGLEAAQQSTARDLFSGKPKKAKL